MEFEGKTCEEIAALINGGTLSPEDLAAAQFAFAQAGCDVSLLSGGGGSTPPVHP